MSATRRHQCQPRDKGLSKFECGLSNFECGESRKPADGDAMHLHGIHCLMAAAGQNQAAAGHGGVKSWQLPGVTCQELKGRQLPVLMCSEVRLAQP